MGVGEGKSAKILQRECQGLDCNLIIDHGRDREGGITRTAILIRKYLSYKI
jgi:hypothetical protein